MAVGYADAGTPAALAEALISMGDRESIGRVTGRSPWLRRAPSAPLWVGGRVRPAVDVRPRDRKVAYHPWWRGAGLLLVEASKAVSAAHRCNRTMTCRPLLDTDAACRRQPLRCSAWSLVESSWRPAVPRTRLLPGRQLQPGRPPRARRRARPAPAGLSLASSR